MRQLSLFPEPAIEHEAFARRAEIGKYSYLEIGLRQNDDGTWAIDTGHQVLGYGGHGGPYYGRHQSFEDAFRVAVMQLKSPFRHILTTNDSVASDKHRSMSKTALKWIDDLVAEFQIEEAA